VETLGGHFYEKDMRGNRQRQCVTVASVLVMFFSSGLSRAQDTDSVLRNRLVLPELIQEVLARNPEMVIAGITRQPRVGSIVSKTSGFMGCAMQHAQR
jgi:hypothetical protein